ncbi:RNA polymerase sigma factor [Nocardia asteroides]|uniref:RNA polymerase sigma factor n=1 Tax=Nocardia asteroides TaxID=1824 RepID=UPI001E5ECFE2|nr:sigma-70 family RNA polymerase sigma factor [Nocardia asteroides]UGT60941.1 sigma-70 family RNA polymerase sigma factor [Nocardia asteroides]
MSVPEPVGDLLRRCAPQVLTALVRRYGHFDAAEDAVQEALLAAVVAWPESGVPDDPRAWLVAVAARKLIDAMRSDSARARREELLSLRTGAAAAQAVRDTDDTIELLFLCCHPALTPADRIALTLRAVGGLTTAEIARAFLVAEATMGKRITRAKRKIAGIGLAPLTPAEQPERLAAVLHVLYLIFTEGYAATAGPALHRAELSAEAIRLARLLHRLLPDEAEVTGVLALMLLTDARRAARTGPGGEPVPMAEQDRTRWDAAAIAEGTALITAALPTGVPGPYQLQAAIAALHDEAPSDAATDWPQIELLYRELRARADNPVTALNHAVAVAMARGPAAALPLVLACAADPRLRGDHRPDTVLGHLYERLGRRAEARAAFRRAAALARTLPRERYLLARAARLAESGE